MNNLYTFLCAFLTLLLSHFTHAQTANDAIRPYNEPFLPGVNLGYFPGLSNEDLADLAAGNEAEGIKGLGAKSIRTGIFNEFVEVWGYDFLEATYDNFAAKGLRENTVIVGFPAAWQRDQTFHCPDQQSTMFANLYEPIFDDGANGTPINDDNYLALYLYKLVSQYKDHVRFWEIWNEPGSDLPTGFQIGWRPPGFPGNWWENEPDPCDNILHAPISHYVRTLRVSYEVIKSVDPTAYVSVAGFGYPSFLDAVLRTTDNPVDGSPTPEYPLGGGAYFDVFGNHSYPHFDGSTTNFDEGRFERHSDRAADGIVTRRLEFEEVLAKYGYDGVTYPLKPSIITEVNVPRKRFGDNLGGIDVQTNFIIKAFIKAKINDVYVIHPYNMIERDDYETATSEFGVMGMYEQFNTAGQQVPTGEAVAYKTTSDLLYVTTYDAQQTAAMQVPTGVRGHAFKTNDGQYIYALWAETSIDLSEAADARYTFPATMNVGDLELIQWDYSENEATTVISPTNIPLTARPILLRSASAIAPPPPSDDLTDLVLSISVSDLQPSIFASTTLTLTVENQSNVDASNVEVSLPLANGELAYIGHEASTGDYFNWQDTWTIPQLPKNSQAQLTVDVFTLTEGEIPIFAQIVAQTPNDVNATANNGVCCTPNEDDEAVIVLNEIADCICLTLFDPVCGSDGKTYGNACEAECAGVTYTAGNCDNGGDEEIDLALEARTQDSTFLIYKTVMTSFVLKNEGNATATNIKVNIRGYEAMAYANHTLSAGEFYDWTGDWTIPSLAAGEVTTLTLGLFTLRDIEPHTIFAQVAAASEKDIDSAPDNNETTIAAEDDEAVLFLQPLNNLNGNTAQFRSQVEKANSTVLQQVYPNPTVDELTVRLFSKKTTETALTIYDLHGKIMSQRQETLTTGTQLITIPVSNLPAGMYFLEMAEEGRYRRSVRFVKQGN
ncbi:MAG: T9SS type A sorting domain-containing protein [Bacteroidota bacterium]